MCNRLHSFLLGFAVASVLVGALFAFVIMPHRNREIFESGRRTGVIDAHFSLLPKIKTTLGDDYRNSDGYQTLFTVKTDAAVVVERNGVKTLRVYADRP